jgi:O-methyltransferase involved in polyketide biosynthesis
MTPQGSLRYENNGDHPVIELTKVSETLYVPLAGRIYASQKHPDILFDKAALSVANRLPEIIKAMEGQTEYTYLASAVRSRNSDRHIKRFLRLNPEAMIINVGCGLETAFHSNDNESALWFELDLPEVLKLRSQYFPESARDRYLPFSMFDETWIKTV